MIKSGIGSPIIVLSFTLITPFYHSDLARISPGCASAPSAAWEGWASTSAWFENAIAFHSYKNIPWDDSSLRDMLDQHRMILLRGQLIPLSTFNTSLLR
ncbi:MAG: hypothetical protein R2759_10475 [Bacteroidales bacterium]